MDKLKGQLFPLREHLNIRIGYALGMIRNGFVTESNWLFYFLMIVNYEQIGILDAVAFTFALMLEIPAGALADLIGKKKLLIISFFAGFIGISMMAIGLNYLWLLIGNSLFLSSMALASGSYDALIYDTLVEHGIKSKYTAFVSARMSIEKLYWLIAVGTGVIAFTINPRLPMILWAIEYFIGFLLCFRIHEPKVDTEKFNLRNFIKQNTMGMRTLFGQQLRPYAFFFLVFLGVMYIYEYSLMKMTLGSIHGLFSAGQGVVYIIEAVLLFFALRLIPRIKKKFDTFHLLSLIAVVGACALLLLSTLSNILGIIGFVVFPLCTGLAIPLLNIVVNDNVRSEVRAGTLSSSAFLYRIPFVVLSIQIGISAQNNQLQSLVFMIGLVLGALTLINFILYLFRK